MKCVRCGRLVGLTARGMRLFDGNYICFKCFDALGFDKSDRKILNNIYTWDEIKNGKDAYEKRRWHSNVSPTLSFADYGQEKDTNAEIEEIELYQLIKQAVKDSGRDPEAMRLHRRAKSYISVSIGDTDVCRLKYTERAKWIQFPYDFDNSEKRYIEDVMLDSGNVKALLDAYDFAVGTNNGLAYRRPE